MTSTGYDVVVVGGGAAGLSAALVLGRARRRVVVVDAGAPRNAPAAHMQGFLSRDGCRRRTSWPRAGSRSTGARDALPEIPGVRERWGRDLLHCPYCHGWEVRDQPIGVLGTNPGSVQHALLVRQWSDDVVFFANTVDPSPDELSQLEARGVAVLRGAVVRLVVEADQLTGVELADGQVIPRTAVFIRPVNVPHADELLAGPGVTVDAAGFAIVDATGRTSAPGVWAAGNVVDRPKIASPNVWPRLVMRDGWRDVSLGEFLTLRREARVQSRPHRRRAAARAIRSWRAEAREPPPGVQPGQQGWIVEVGREDDRSTRRAGLGRAARTVPKAAACPLADPWTYRLGDDPC